MNATDLNDAGITDDRVAALFAAANPSPVRTDTSSDAAAVRVHLEAITTVDGSAPGDGSSGRSRVWLVALAAGIVGLVIGAALAFARRDAAVAPADTTPTPATVATEKTADVEPLAVDGDQSDTERTAAVRIGEELLDALLRRDVAATESLLAADYRPSIAPGSDDAIADQLAWLDAWNWSWTLDTCGYSAVDDRVWCSADGGNRLTEQAGASMRLSAVLRVTGDVVTDFSWSGEGRGVDRIFGRFQSWVASRHPADADVMWPHRDGVWTVSSSPEAIELFRDRLIEYTSTDTPPLGVPELYADAARRGAVAELDALLLPDAQLDDFWATAVSDYEATARLLDALRINPIVTYCGVGQSTADGWGTAQYDCSIELDNEWGVGDVELPRTTHAVFELESGRISAVRSSGADMIIDELTPWFDWLDEHHPGDLDRMFEAIDGERRPRLTDEAIGLIRERVDDYLAETAG